MATEGLKYSYRQTLDFLSDVFTQRPISFRREFIPIAESAAGALFLSQALYWTGKGENKEWFFKSQDEWRRETGLTRYEQESARKILKAKGVLLEKRMGCPFRLHFRISIAAIYKILSALSQQSHSAENSTLDCGVPENNSMDCGNPTDHSAENSTLYKEAKITTKNTTENTEPTLLFEIPKNQFQPESVVESVFTDWIRDLGRSEARYTLTPKRKAMLLSRLQDCTEMTKEPEAAESLMGLLITTMAKSEFHREKGYDDIEQIFRSREQMEKWISRSETTNGHRIDEEPEDDLKKLRQKEAARRGAQGGEERKRDDAG